MHFWSDFYDLLESVCQYNDSPAYVSSYPLFGYKNGPHRPTFTSGHKILEPPEAFGQKISTKSGEKAERGTRPEQQTKLFPLITWKQRDFKLNGRIGNWV